MEDQEESDRSLEKSKELDLESTNKQFLIEEEKVIITKESKEKLDKWEPERYNVSSLKNKWLNNDY